jgi:hypothetical protein
MEARDTIQICATVAKSLHVSVKEEATRDNRSFSEMVGILLTQAIKERERQRAKNSRRISK